MAILDHIIGLGTPVGTATAIVGGVTSIIAAGNSLATGTLISSGTTFVTLTSSGKGVTLPACAPGSACYVYNGGANTLAVFPNVSTEAISNGSAGAAFSVGTNKGSNFVKLTATQWGVNLSA